MIQKIVYTSIIFLSLFLHNEAFAFDSNGTEDKLRDEKAKSIELVNLWDSVNTNPSVYKDPYNIVLWEALLLEKYNKALQNKDEELIFKLSIPLSFTYHSETKFKKGLPILEYLFKNTSRLSILQYQEVLIKLEEEYRASNNIEQAILIRKERISNHFINNYWEIYRDCGLFDAAKNELIHFVQIPPLYSTRRLSYYFLLGQLYFDMKEVDSAKIIYTKGFEEAKATILLNDKTHSYEDQKLVYWKACFMGFIVKCNILKGDYTNAISSLKYDIEQSFENSDNKVFAMNALCMTYIHYKKFKEAKIYIDSVSELLSEKTAKAIQKEHLLIYSDYYAQINKKDSALYYYQKYNAYHEQLYQNIQKNQSVLLLAQMEISNRRTELLESNQSLSDSNKENSKQRVILMGLVFSLLLSIIVGVFLYLNSVAKSKSNKKIEAQSREINEHSNKIESQFNHNEILLKELHHRVKNNLQVMYSLLNLQKRRNQDVDTIETLSSIQNRIQTMALVHQNLYTSGDFEMVEIATYIKTLANHLESIYKVDKKKIEMVFNIDESLKLSIETVVAIGLIVNEAVSNSFKYAFKNKQGGKVIISIICNEVETEITIQDNGEGLGQVPKKENSLGMKLIQLMCLQLKAVHSLEQTNGVTHYIKFNKVS
jgi:two-component sensor histidine kinase